MKNMYELLPKPFLTLAPMDDVTDTVFRQIVAKIGKPDLFFTEFTNTDGLCSQGIDAAKQKLQFTQNERPIAAQIWGNKPDNYFKSAQLIEQMGFDGIDINLGCPDKHIVKKGCCSGLIMNQKLVRDLIDSTRNGAPKIPLSIKTRLGYNKLQTQDWIGFLLQQSLDALTIHGRIATEMSKFPANWEEIGKAVLLKKKLKSKTLIIGNGDIKNRDDALEKYKKYGVDGIMVGRGIFNDPWIFNKDRTSPSVPFQEKIELLIEHIDLFEKIWGNKKPFEMFKKFYKMYISDISDAHLIRIKLMELNTPKEVKEFLRKLI